MQGDLDLKASDIAGDSDNIDDEALTPTSSEIYAKVIPRQETQQEKIPPDVATHTTSAH